MSKRRIVSLFIIVTLMVSMFSGCNQKEVAIPELNDPVAVRESFRPVDYGDVGKIELLYGDVVPMDRCYFWKISSTVDKIHVQLGDYVEAGEVLASASVGTIREEIADLNAQIKHKNEVYAIELENYGYKHKELEYATVVAQGTTQAEQAGKNIQQLEENHRFDEQLHEFEIEQLKEEIAERQKLIEKETLVADTSGYVTYIKDMSESNRAAAYENVVIVSDYENSYIELSSISMASLSRSKITIYSRYYTEINAERYYLEEYEYSAEEQVIIENKMKYPNVRMKMIDGGELPPVGTTLPIFMTTTAEENVLCVGNDSLYSDAGGDYVYVKKGDTKEVRYITVGKKGDCYTEVLSGLEKGELVSYIVTNLLPDDYSPYEVKLGDYDASNSANNYKQIGAIASSCYSEVAGTIITVNAREKKNVQAGDLICQIKTDVGNAKLQELSDALTTLQENYELQLKGFDSQKDGIYQMTQMTAAQWLGESSSLQNQISSGKNSEGVVLTPAEIESLKQALASAETRNSYKQLQYEMQTQQVECSRKIAELSYQFNKKNMEAAYKEAGKNNDGSGIVNVYAEADGEVYSTQYMREDEIIKKGDRLFCIMSNERDMLLYNSMSRLKLNQEVTFTTDKDVNKKYTGTVIAYGSPDKAYLTSDGTDTYLTSNIMKSNAPMYYIRVNDAAFFEETYAMNMNYSDVALKGVAIVPRGTVKREVVEDKEYLFVWKIEDGLLVKTFVRTIGDANTIIISGLKPGDIVAVDN